MNGSLYLWKLFSFFSQCFFSLESYGKRSKHGVLEMGGAFFSFGFSRLRALRAFCSVSSCSCSCFFLSFLGYLGHLLSFFLLEHWNHWIVFLGRCFSFGVLCWLTQAWDAGFFFFFLAGSRMGIGMGQLSLTIDLWFSTRYSPSSSTYLCNDPCETTSSDLAVSSGINVSRQCGYGNRWSLDRL